MTDILFKNNTAAILNATSIAGRHVVTTAQATANAAAIDLSASVPAIDMAVVQILRAGAVVTADAVITFSTATITVADGGSTYNMTAGDVINYFACGSLTA